MRLVDLAAARIDQADHPAAHALFNGNLNPATMLVGDGKIEALVRHCKYPAEASNTWKIAKLPNARRLMGSNAAGSADP